MSALKPRAHNLVDPELQKLFLVHRDAYVKAKKKQDDASNALRSLVKTIKGDGFKLLQIKDAIWLSTPEGEAEFKAEMAGRLLAAAYVNADIGDQLSLFLDNPRVPAVERAFKEGVACAMENKAAVPKYDPATPQYTAFMEGFHEETGRMVKGGIKKLDAKKGKGGTAPEVGKPKGKRGRPAKDKGAAPAGSERTLITKAEKDAKAAAKAPKADAGPPRRPTVAPVTRAGLAARKDAAKETAESYFTKSTEPAGSA